MNLRRLEIALVAAAMMMIVVASYQLFVAPGNSQSSDGNWKAWLSALENSAKHRRANDLVWRDLYQGERLSDGASVFTGDESSAAINFQEGQQLRIAANTLLRIQSVDMSQVLVEKGIIQTQLGKATLQLEMNGKKIELVGNGAEVQIVNDGSTAALSVLKGSATMTEGAKTFDLEQNDEAQVSKTAETKKASLAYELLTPAAGQVLWTRDRASVEMSWSGEEEKDQRLVIARDIQLRDVVLREELRGRSRKIDLDAGTYFWQISSSLGKSRLGVFTVKREAQIQIQYPETKSVISLPIETETSWPVTLRWSAINVEAYDVTWRTDNQSKTLRVHEAQATIQVPLDQMVHWQVTPVDEARPLAIASEEGVFTVKKILPPVAVSWVKSGPLSLSKRSDDASTDVGWIGEGHRFEWEIRQGEARLQAGVTTARELRLPLTDAGDYQVFVRAFDEFDRAGPWSEKLEINWRPFESRPLDEGQKIVLASPDQKISFSWDGEDEQLFELASDSTFTKVLVTQRGIGATEIVFPQVGTFFWRARKVLPNGTSVYSAPRKVIVEPTPPLATPVAPPALKKEIEIQFTAPKSTWIDWVFPRAFASDFQTSVTLELPPTDAAKKYRVEIFADEALTQLVFTTTTPDVSFEWKGARPGRYWWRYSLIDAWSRETAMSQASVLDLVAGTAKAPEKPRLLVPIRSIKIAEAESMNFKWRSAARAMRYELQVATDDDFDEVLFQAETNKTELMVPTTNWGRGEILFWRVRARHDWGETQSNTGRFQLGEKKILTPEEKLALPWRSAEPYSWLRIGFNPQNLKATLDDREFSGEINGLVLNSVGLAGRLQKKNWSIKAQILRQGGNVFDDEDFSRTEASVLFERVWRLSERSFAWIGLGGTRASVSSYRLMTPTKVAFEKDISALSPRLQGEWEWRAFETSSVHVQGAFQTGDWSGLQFEASWRKFFRYRMFYEIGFMFESMRLKTDRGNQDMSSQGLSILAGLSY